MNDRTGSGDPQMPPEQLAAVFDQLLEGLQVLSPDWTYLYVNESAARHGRSTSRQLLGRSMFECYPGIEKTPLFATMTRCMEERVPVEFDNEFTYPDGSTAWFELRMRPVPQGVVVLSLDVTERRRLDDRLKRAQAMEAVGRLAGGVAHDFNNVLAAIGGFGEVVLDAVGPRHEVYEDVVQIMEAVERAGGLVSQLLALSARRVVHPDLVDVGAHLDGLLPMLRRLAGPAVEVRYVPGEAVGEVRMDRTGLERVVVNLVVNARDAMPRGGTVVIETRAIEEDQVLITVSDGGEGMSAETMDHVFEPFFTTKAMGRGTGLGLSTCMGIVRQAGGSIQVHSDENLGTTFSVRLPRASGQPLPAVIPTPVRGSETVLVASPNTRVLDLAERTLEAAGYGVMTARDGAEAIDLTIEADHPIDLLVTTRHLPDMSGNLLYKCLRGERSGLEVLQLEPSDPRAMDPALLLSAVRARFDAR
ncbi:MAG: PAS domain-containing protein [Alphaproteobacteria bacterium]|nr:PAS domain-containing protein [Alphaproteobacteria bacterium]MCB9695717.1 PAS domain-containing protein [Alphaproteobacteria bacterium]